MFQIWTRPNKGQLYLFLACITFLLITFVVTTPVDAQRDENTVAGIWTFDDGTANDSSNQNLNGVIVGKPESVRGIVGKALKFNGSDQGIQIPDSNRINMGGPFTKRTVAAFFKCDNVNKNEKQVIFEEGGKTRGLVIYVFEGAVYIGGWNRAEYQWAGAWLSTKVKSNRWYHIALVIRDATNKVEKDKFEMWLDGKLTEKAGGGQLHQHGDNTGIGYVHQNAVFHDEKGGDASNVDWFGGLIDEVVVYNSAFTKADLAKLAKPLNVDPSGKFTTTWANLKAQSTLY